MKTKNYFIIIIALLSLFVAKPHTARAQNGNSPVTVEKIRVGKNKESVRIVIETSGTPDFSFYSIQDSAKLYLDIFDAKLSARLGKIRFPKDPLLHLHESDQHNFRQVRLTFCLKYGVPINNINVFTLKEPSRIVVDIHRDYDDFVKFHLTKNILWIQSEKAKDGRFTLINELYVDQKSPDVRVEVETANANGRSRETVPAMVKRKNAIAGINGGYFSNSGQHLSLLVKNGRVIASSVNRRPPRTAFGITLDKDIVFARVVNKGQKLVTSTGNKWKPVVTALGGGPRLIANGEVHVTAKAEGLGKGGNDITRRAGRSVIGVNKEGKMAFFTFSDYRDNHKGGLKLEETARYLKNRNIHNAMNLDGGGSTSMAIMGQLVSRSLGHGNYLRPVTNAVLIYDDSPIISPCSITMEPSSLEMPADGVTRKNMKICVTDNDGKAVPDNTPISVSSGAGLLEKKYYNTVNGAVDLELKSVRAPGNYTVKVECGPLQSFIPLKLTAGESAEILTKVGKLRYSIPNGRKNGNGSKIDPNPGYSVKALIRDAYKNPLKGKCVAFEVLEGEGTLTTRSQLTAVNGMAETNLTKTSGPAKIKVSVTGMEPVYVEIK